MYRLLSLFFALLLFFYVSYQRLGTTRISDKEVANSKLTTTKTLSLKVPLTLNVDNSKYYVTGYPEQVKVDISGPSALVTTLDNTRNFEVYADLSDLKSGTHTVKLKTSGFNKELSVALSPEKIKVKIAPKKTVKMPIQVRYDTGLIQNGYVAGSPSLSTQTVDVTGAKADINKLDSVVANLNLPENSHGDYGRTVLLQALDKEGHPLPVSLSPETVKVNLPISQATATKEVKLELVTENNGVPGKTYQLSTETKLIKLRGTKSALNKINSLRVPVSVTGVNESTTKTVSLSPTQAGVASVTPASIVVQITVGDEQADDPLERTLPTSSSSSKAAESTSSSQPSSTDESKKDTTETSSATSSSEVSSDQTTN